MPAITTLFASTVKLCRGLLDTALLPIFPHTCEICDNSLVAGERIICLDCDLLLPRANTHLHADNRVSEQLARRIPQCRVASWFYYESGEKPGKLIHQLKYSGRPELGRQLGELFAREIINTGFFRDIDIILYVPLHPIKFLKRGYNQSRQIALGASRATGIRVADNICARVARRSQTRLSGTQRISNARGKYKTRRGHELDGKNILVVDDIITTGATIVAAIDSVLDVARPASVKALSLGITQQH
jgi:ComF family protein